MEGGPLDVNGARALAERLEQERVKRAESAGGALPSEPEHANGEGRAPAPLMVNRRWNHRGLVALVDAAGGRHPEQIDEWRAFLAQLAPQVEDDGFLPATLNPLVSDVLSDALGTAATARRAS